MPLPVAHALVGALIAESLLPRDTTHRGLKAFAVAGLAVAPDLDFLLVWILGLDRDWHRGFSHSLVMAGLLGAVALLGTGATRYREWGVASIAVASHGLLDALTTVDGRGVQLFWPFWLERFKFGVVDLWEMQPGWLAAGELGRAVQVSLLELVVLAPFVAGLAWVRHVATRRSDRSPAGTGLF